MGWDSSLANRSPLESPSALPSICALTLLGGVTRSRAQSFLPARETRSAALGS